ncbi:equilibrative nucleoside transporter 3 [Schistocerca serialis cubense]|uniref:equilibrative nucleoside transporter 3 n=1 Tax=Schistocerca serialis cubense TaxID=2023355 RepID=UPI00214EF087|nr:equilibrative nucleoside transporter 3 [Schistocerca serialis cubense]
MEYSVNTRPLLQQSESESDFDDGAATKNHPAEDDDHVVVTDDVKPLFKVREPCDRFNLAYVIFYLLGMTTLLPWCFFITADDYWMYKLRDVNQSSFEIYDLDIDQKSDLQASFTAYLSVASTVPNTLFLVLNSLLSHRISLKIRMVGSVSIVVLLFIETTVLVKIDTDNWQEIFFIVTLATVVVLNIASAVLQGGLFGIVAKFPSRYITAVVSGQALGGIFAALAEIVSLCIGATPVNSAFVYFMIADGTLILSLIAYLVLSRSVFFQYFTKEKEAVSTLQYEPATIEAIDRQPVREISYKTILSKMWVYGFSVWMTFFVTLSLYPSVTVLINSTKKGNGSAWNDIYFVPVVAYLIFSLCDYIGRITAGILKWPRGSAWLIGLISILRVVFIPLFLMCNAHPRHHGMPLLINSDVYYIILMVIFGLSNGYLANITLICVPRVVDAAEQETASSMMAAFLGLGLACGSALSLLLIKVL